MRWRKFNGDIIDLPIINAVENAIKRETAAGFKRFTGPIFVLLSGHDYIAREFEQVTKSSPAWRGLLEHARVTKREMAGADHTFSRDVWKNQASDWIAEWIAKW